MIDTIFLSGVPATGKSSFARKFKEYYSGTTKIVIRKLVPRIASLSMESQHERYMYAIDEMRSIINRPVRNDQVLIVDRSGLDYAATTLAFWEILGNKPSELAQAGVKRELELTARDNSQRAMHLVVPMASTTLQEVLGDPVRMELLGRGGITEDNLSEFLELNQTFLTHLAHNHIRHNIMDYTQFRGKDFGWQDRLLKTFNLILREV